MRTTLELPKPCLSRGLFASIAAYTDEGLFDRCGVRIAFTERSGGASAGPYDSLNLGSAVNDAVDSVRENRRILAEALGAGGKPVLIPRQVHGDSLVTVADAGEDAIERYRMLAEAGADGIIIGTADVAALLCYADCIPVVIVSPSGRFAVVHAGWRGVEEGIAAKALASIMACDASEGQLTDASRYNIYIGAHIRACCFETGEDVHRRFVGRFGLSCSADGDRIDLNRALRIGLARAGAVEQRIADVGICTVCESDRFFSYRAQKGTCGRHGAFAIRIRG